MEQKTQTDLETNIHSKQWNWQRVKQTKCAESLVKWQASKWLEHEATFVIE